jgi:hypothetical protein
VMPVLDRLRLRKLVSVRMKKSDLARIFLRGHGSPSDMSITKSSMLPHSNSSAPIVTKVQGCERCDLRQQLHSAVRDTAAA